MRGRRSVYPNFCGGRDSLFRAFIIRCPDPHERCGATPLMRLWTACAPAGIRTPAPAVHRPAHERGLLIGVGGAQGQYDGVQDCGVDNAFDPVLSHLGGPVQVPNKGCGPFPQRHTFFKSLIISPASQHIPFKRGQIQPRKFFVFDAHSRFKRVRSYGNNVGVLRGKTAWWPSGRWYFNILGCVPEQPCHFWRVAKRNSLDR